LLGGRLGFPESFLRVQVTRIVTYRAEEVPLRRFVRKDIVDEVLTFPIGFTVAVSHRDHRKGERVRVVSNPSDFLGVVPQDGAVHEQEGVRLVHGRVAVKKGD
jgi:hypothetical protein